MNGHPQAIANPASRFRGKGCTGPWMRACWAILFLCLLFLPGWAALAKAGDIAGLAWVDAREVAGFRVFCRFPADRIAPLLEDLDGLAKDVAAYLGLEAAPQAVDVYLFADAQEYGEAIHRAFPEVPYRRALFVKRGERAMVAAYLSRELAVDLRHECTHALLHSALPMVPLWLDEGLAEYFELEPARRAGGSPYLSTVRWRCRFGLVPSLERLERLRFMDSMTEADYRDAWSWVHFMLHGPAEAREALLDYLNTIHRGGIPGNLGERLAERVPDLKGAFRKHFAAWGR